MGTSASNVKDKFNFARRNTTTGEDAVNRSQAVEIAVNPEMYFYVLPWSARHRVINLIYSRIFPCGCSGVTMACSIHIAIFAEHDEDRLIGYRRVKDPTPWNNFEIPKKLLSSYKFTNNNVQSRK